MKETKELVVGLLKISALLAETLKDGVQVQDIAVVIGKIQANKELSDALVAAYNDVELCKDEVKDIDLAKAIEIMGVALPEILVLVKALSKK
jgi:hypothetical protein